MSENNNTKKITTKRCKKGTRRNPKTGICEPVEEENTTVAPNIATVAPVATVLEPVIEELATNATVAPVLEPVIEELVSPAVAPIIEPVIEELATPVIKELVTPVVAPVVAPVPKKQRKPRKIKKKMIIENNPIEKPEPSNKTKRCPRGYQMDKKTGICHKTQKNKKGKETLENVPIQEEETTDISDIVEQNVGVPVADDIMSQLKPQKNDKINQIEKKEYYQELENPDSTYDFLYPNLNDPNFNIKIAKRKEFFNTRYDGSIKDIQKQAELFCKAEFELMPHQNFVKNFLSFQTPYNSLLLYHSLGTGKTCSSIGIAEEMRTYMKQIGIKQRILVVASPNVQANFRLQLFDERKLKQIANPIQPNDTIWNIESCIGNSLLKEINPTNNKGITREKIISQINSIINTFYVFMGYGQLANYITEKTKMDDEINYSNKERTNIEIKKIKQFFNNRLIIIDEVHNIRLTDENNNKKVAVLLMKVAKYSDNMRLLLLSATPMYNSYKEIIWLTNLMNLNDKRSIIEVSDVFEKDGSFKEERTLEDG